MCQRSSCTVNKKCFAVHCARVDLPRTGVHIAAMNFDISHLLESWDYQAGQVIVRKFTAKDGVEKIQLRVDLGLLQMNAEGRPDGKRPKAMLRCSNITPRAWRNTAPRTTAPTRALF